MDEPLASLDRERKDEVLPFLARLPRKLDMPIIYVSHSWREISFLGAKVVRVAEGRAREPESSRPPDAAAAKRRSAGRR
jgi:molybdate transport system ATP-binding protein